MNYTFRLSRKLKLNGSHGSANSTGVAIAVTGVTLAIIIMELTIAIVLGFKHSISKSITGFEGDMWVLPPYTYYDASSESLIMPDSVLDSLIQTNLPGANTYMRFSQPGLLKTDNDFAGIYFTGEDNGELSKRISECIIEGHYPDLNDEENANKIVISKNTSRELGIDTCDRVNAFFFVDGSIKSRRLEVAAIYESGFTDYDKTVALASTRTLKKIAAADSLAGTRLIMTLPEGEDIESSAAKLQEAIINAYQNGTTDKLYPVDNVRHTGAIYFNWLDLLDTNVVAIFVLMICVSGFTLISSMFIIILERIPTIGILRSLGSTKRQIRQIFVYMAMRIVGIGMLIGNIIGISLIAIQSTYRIMPLDADMYYMHYVPVELNWLYIVLLNAGVAIMTWLILIAPSHVASGISPASTIRYE